MSTAGEVGGDGAHPDQEAALACGTVHLMIENGPGPDTTALD
jgi:hypothetical protein